MNAVCLRTGIAVRIFYTGFLRLIIALATTKSSFLSSAPHPRRKYAANSGSPDSKITAGPSPLIPFLSWQGFPSRTLSTVSRAFPLSAHIDKRSLGLVLLHASCAMRWRASCRMSQEFHFDLGIIPKSSATIASTNLDIRTNDLKKKHPSRIVLLVFRHNCLKQLQVRGDASVLSNFGTVITSHS